MRKRYQIALCLFLMVCILAGCRRGKVDETTANTQETSMPTQASEEITLPLPTGNDPTGNTAGSLPADPLPGLME